jgi:hypothetical protein
MPVSTAYVERRVRDRGGAGGDHRERRRDAATVGRERAAHHRLEVRALTTAGEASA